MSAPLSTSARLPTVAPAASKSESAIDAPSPAPVFDRNIGAERDEFLDGLGNGGAARLARRFLQDRDLHPVSLQDQEDDEADDAGRRSRPI